MIIDPVSQSLQRLPMTATEPARPPAQSALPAADPGTPTLSIRPAASSSIEPASLPETVGARIYEAIDAIGVGLKPKVASDGAKVDAAKQKLSPDAEVLSASGRSPGAGSNEGLDMLNKAFDHAVFLAAVNQVVSGVGDTARTLVRQQ